MAHLEQRYRTWYVTLTVPADLREHFGKAKLFQSLKTPDKRIAEVRAGQLVSQWKAQFLHLRGITNPQHLEATKWKQELREKADDPEQLAIATEFLIERTKQLEATKGSQTADDFFGLATDTRTVSSAYFEQWKAQIDLAPRTKDQMFKDVGLLVTRFSAIESITKKAVKAWMEELDKNGKGSASQKRILSFCRNYWKYLQAHDVVPVELDPFSGVLTISKVKKTAGSSWLPFSPAEVVALWKKAGDKGDTQLQDLILLGAYTGARIEELCALRVADITNTVFRIRASKTTAGNRDVPIHSALTSLVKRLKQEAQDEYLISGLTFNKYGDRSNAIGKRFGRLKKGAGHPDSLVFHSIRKTFTTELENAGVPENVTADIVGHEKPSITYGLYSGGNKYEVMKDAIELARYPFPG